MRLVLFLALLLASGGAHAAGIAGLAFVPSRLAPQVAVIDTRSDAVVRRLPTGTPPLHAAVSESLRRVVTTSWRGNLVNLIDPDGILPPEQIAIGLRPDGIELDPSGKVLAISSIEDNRVALVDLAGRRELALLDGFATPHHLTFAADGRRLYVSNLGANYLTVVDVAAGAVAGRIELGEPEEDLGGIGNISVAPDGKRLLVTLGSGARLAVVDPERRAVESWIAVGELPWRAFPTGDGRRVVVPNNGDGTASVLDGASLAELARIPVGGDISSVNTAWFETVAFVLSRDRRSATVIDLDRAERLAEIALPGTPEAAVASDDGARLYVALGDAGSVAVIDVRERRLASVIDDVVRRPWSVQIAGALNYCR